MTVMLTGSKKCGFTKRATVKGSKCVLKSVSCRMGPTVEITQIRYWVAILAQM